jgi:ABC-type polysaccharide/polyol phosphate transport system ATPase subunit
MSTSSPALRFEGVTKSFAHGSARKLLREKLADLVRPAEGARFKALDNVTFSVAPGESLGLIGANGAGKSTLLNIATGLALPDAGRVEARGRVSAILELGAGFHGDLTGAENLHIHAALIGLSRRQTVERFETIVEFSGVRDFIHDPLRTYSAGMIVRLAFSIAVHADPDLLLIDEAIGVGDQEFHQKCLEKIQQLQRQGKTMVVASHALGLVTMLCQKALWLDHGRVVRFGPVKEVAAAYQAGVRPDAAQHQTSPSP